MAREIFRRKSLDRIQSPESLNDYIRVASPSVWLLMVGIIALLVGALVWGLTGHIDSTVPATVQISEGGAVCVLETSEADVEVGMPVKFASIECEVAGVEGGYSLSIPQGVELPEDGEYAAELVVSRVKPFSFITD